MAQPVVTIFGGGGFVGRYFVRALLMKGFRVRVAERHPKQAYELKAQANLGQISFAPADILRPETLAPVIAGSDCVINLVGSFAHMDAVHVAGARAVAEAAAAADVGALLHMSAIGADPHSPSGYGRTKGEGEVAVRAAFPAATILRPSIIFARDDKFINRFAGLIRAMPVMPVLGSSAIMQPVFAGDVAAAGVAALDHPGETFELGGPQVLTLGNLERWIARAIGHDPLFLDLPDSVSAMIAMLTGWLPGAPITRDQWLMLQSPNKVADGAKGLSELGIAATPLDAVTSGWLVSYRKHGRFGAAA